MNNSIIYRCPKCNDIIDFNNDNNLYYCKKCEVSYKQDELLNDTNKLEKERIVYECSKCEVNFSSQEKLSNCIYCNETVDTNSKFKSIIKYNYIIPFKYTNKEIIRKIKKYIKSKPLFPKEFNINKNIEKINKIYVPLWLFDFDASGELEISGKKVSKFKSKEKKYIKTDSYLSTLGGNMKFKNVPVYPSEKLNKNIFQILESIDNTKYEEFNYNYLDGVVIEEQTLKIKDIINLGEEKVKELFTNKILSEMDDYSQYNLESSSINIRNTKKECVLIPIWLLTINYKNEKYHIILNEQTGKVSGNIPISISKLVFKFVLTFLITFIILYLLLHYKVIA